MIGNEKCDCDKDWTYVDQVVEESGVDSFGQGVTGILSLLDVQSHIDLFLYTASLGFKDPASQLGLES